MGLGMGRSWLSMSPATKLIQINSANVTEHKETHAQTDLKEKQAEGSALNHSTPNWGIH